MNGFFRATSVAFLVMAGAAVVACGDDDDGGGAAPGGATAGSTGGSSGGGTAPTVEREASSTVPDATPISDVTPEQATALCEDLVANAESLAAVELDPCPITGYFAAAILAGVSDETTDAELQAICSESVSACEADDGSAPPDVEPPDVEPIDCSRAAEELPANCNASVGEIFTCYDELFGVVQQLFDAPACNTLTRASLESAEAFNLASPASCAALETSCPELALPSLGLDDFGGDLGGDFGGDDGTGSAPTEPTPAEP